MATKKELIRDARKAGLVPETVGEDDFTAAQLEALLDPEKAPPAWEGSLSATKPVVSPDGHVHLSKQDIDARSA